MKEIPCKNCGDPVEPRFNAYDPELCITCQRDLEANTGMATPN